METSGDVCGSGGSTKSSKDADAKSARGRERLNLVNINNAAMQELGLKDTFDDIELGLDSQDTQLTEECHLANPQLEDPQAALACPSIRCLAVCFEGPFKKPTIVLCACSGRVHIH